MNRFLHPSVAILFALFVSAGVAFAGVPAYGTQPVDNPEITAERLDRAVDFILSQDPPFITHGSLYGDCPFWSGGDPKVFVICVGFWTYGAGRNSSERCRHISVWKGDEMVPTGWMLDVTWNETGNVSINGYGVGNLAKEDRDAAEENILAVLKACDRPPKNDVEPEAPATGNVFSDFLARKTVRLGKSLGHSFGTTNRCTGTWVVPASVHVGQDAVSLPFCMKIVDYLDAAALDGKTNIVGSARIQVMPSAFDAEFSLFVQLGLRYEWGSFLSGNVSSNVDFVRENGILFALPNGKSNYIIDDSYQVYAVCSNLLAEAWTGLDRKSFAASLLNEGWKAGSGQSPRSTAVEYGDKRFPGSYSAPEKSKRSSP
jgi:hypothetical protein